MKINISKIHLKKQQHKRSCGQTCVAMIANKSYKQVLKDFKKIYYPRHKNIPFRTWGGVQVLSLGTHPRDLHILLKKYDIKTNKRVTKYTNKDCLPELSILNVFPCKTIIDGKTYTSGHWIVCIKHGRKFVIYDPWFGEMDLRNYKPIRHFIKIYV